MAKATTSSNIAERDIHLLKQNKYDAETLLKEINDAFKPILLMIEEEIAFVRKFIE